MIQVIPALLEESLAVFTARAEAAARFAPYLHVDISDGQFAPTKTITPEELASVRFARPFEVHLMVEDTMAFVQRLLAAKPHRVIAHLADPATIDDYVALLAKNGIEASLAFGPNAGVERMTAFLPFIGKFKHVQFLAVEPGFQGGALQESVLERAKNFHMRNPDMPMEIDGGINATTIAAVKVAQPTMVAVGSALWSATDPALQYADFMRQLNP